MRAMQFVALLVSVAAADVAAPTIPIEYTAVIQARMPYIQYEMPIRVSTGLAAQKIQYYGGLEIDISEARGMYKYAYNGTHRVCLVTSPVIGPARQGPGGSGGAEGPYSQNGLKIWMLNFFPDFSQYAFVGDELIGGILCQRFDTNTRRSESGLMDDHISFYWDPVVNKPVRWHMHAREQTFDSHTDEYFFDYIDFQPGPPPQADLRMPTLCHLDPEAPPDTDGPGGGRMATAAEGFLAAAHSLRVPTVDEAGPLLWGGFVQQYGKTYSSQDERAMRRSIFDDNVRTIRDLSRRHAATTSFRGNYYLDMTQEEMLRIRGGRRTSGAPPSERRTPAQRALVHNHTRTMAPEALARNFDWRTERPGVISPVKDQGWCGSCWTFGLMEPIETIQAVKTGQMNVLPEQFAIDCLWDSFNWSHGVSTQGNAGCGGGFSDHGAFEIVRKFGGLVPTAESYGAYLNIDGYCKDTESMDAGARVEGWVDVEPFNDLALRDALVTQGSISIAIFSPAALNYYDGGVINASDCVCDMQKIDHQVVLVGYGTEESSGLDYWLLRNSWSSYWGDEGYFRLARGALDCCITSEPGYPAVTLLQPSTASLGDDFVVSFV